VTLATVAAGTDRCPAVFRADPPPPPSSTLERVRNSSRFERPGPPPDVCDDYVSASVRTLCRRFAGGGPSFLSSCRRDVAPSKSILSRRRARGLSDLPLFLAPILPRLNVGRVKERVAARPTHVARGQLLERVLKLCLQLFRDAFQMRTALSSSHFPAHKPVWLAEFDLPVDSAC